jgi:glycosyltransferase involved in cell wall biosynthesis
LDIVLVDDGSEDLSGCICDKWAQEDLRIKVIHQKNLGLVAARKIGLKSAQGQFVLFVDGDDWIDVDMVKLLMDRILEDKSDIAQCGYDCIGNGNKSLYPSVVISIDDKARAQIIEKWMLGKPVFDNQIWTKLCRRDLMNEAYSVVPDECNKGEDWIAFISLVSLANKFSSIEETMYHYRIRDNSLSHSGISMELLITNDGILNHVSKLIDNRIPLVDKDVINKWLIKHKWNDLSAYIEKYYGIKYPKYFFTNIDLIQGKRVIIYGAGSCGTDLIKQLSAYADISIAAWVDLNSSESESVYRSVESVEKIIELEWDYLIVALADEYKAQMIAYEIIESYHIPAEKVIWKYKRSIFD